MTRLVIRHLEIHVAHACNLRCESCSQRSGNARRSHTCACEPQGRPLGCLETLPRLPLPPGCTDDRMRAFFTMEVEPQCGMCPAAPERFAIPLPFIRKTGDEVIKA